MQSMSDYYSAIQLRADRWSALRETTDAGRLDDAFALVRDTLKAFPADAALLAGADGPAVRLAHAFVARGEWLKPIAIHELFAQPPDDAPMVALFAVSTWFPLSFAILVVAGVGWSMMVTLNQTLLQINVEDEFRGRVLSLYSMASGFTTFSNLAMGTTADAFGVQGAVAAFALTGFALAAVLGLGSKRVRAL